MVKLLGKKRELPDLLHLRKILVDRIDPLLHQLADLGSFTQVLVGREGDALSRRPVADRVQLDPDQRADELATIPDHDGLADPRRDLEHVLDPRRRDVLAAGGNDQILLAIGDREVPRLVEHTHIPRVQPAVGIDGLTGGVRVAIVAREDPRAFHQDLAVLGDADGRSRNRNTYRPDACPFRGIERGQRRSFRLPVSLLDRHTQGPEELQHLRRNRRGP